MEPHNNILILNHFQGKFLQLCLQIMQLRQGRAFQHPFGQRSRPAWCGSEKNNIIFASVIQGRWKDMNAVGLYGTNRGRRCFQMAALSSTSQFCRGGKKGEKKVILQHCKRSATPDKLVSVFYLEGRQRSGYAERPDLRNVCFETEILPW